MSVKTHSVLFFQQWIGILPFVFTVIYENWKKNPNILYVEHFGATFGGRKIEHIFWNIKTISKCYSCEFIAKIHHIVGSVHPLSVSSIPTIHLYNIHSSFYCSIIFSCPFLAACAMYIVHVIFHHLWVFLCVLMSSLC